MKFYKKKIINFNNYNQKPATQYSSKNRRTKITSIPSYPNLKQLYCSFNELTNLPEFQKLEFLDCGANKLTSISNCPKLKKLKCDSNELINLPEELPKLEI